MLRIIICDETKECINRIYDLISRALRDIPEGRKTEVFSASPDALYKYKIKDNYTYLFLLDVIYGSVNGIEIAKRLRRQYKNIFIVFITNHTELMSMVINQNIMPSGFLAETAGENDIKMMLLGIFDYTRMSEKTESNTLTLSTGSAVYKIRYDEIIFIEALNKKIYIYTETQRISCYNSLYGLEEELGSGFIRCHKSFIVNKDKIKNVHMAEMYIEMTNGSKVSMSRTYKNIVKEMVNEV